MKEAACCRELNFVSDTIDNIVKCAFFPVEGDRCFAEVYGGTQPASENPRICVTRIEKEIFGDCCGCKSHVIRRFFSRGNSCVMGLISDPLLFAVALIDTGSVLFLLVYYIITLSDLECDYLNAQECCSKLNMGVLPKLIAHTFLVFLLLIHGQLILTLVNIPMTVWLFYEYFGVPSGNMGVYDPTEIHNRSQLKRYTRDCMIHLGYCLVFFFIYLYCMIVALLKGDPINRSDETIIDL